MADALPPTDEPTWRQVLKDHEITSPYELPPHVERATELPAVYRTFQLDTRQVDEEARTVQFSFSSEEPVDRFWFEEVLSHAPGAGDLSRLNDGAQFLVNHDVDQVAGVNVSARIEGGRGMATARFGKSAFAEEIFADVVAGIRRNISFAYVIQALERIIAEEGALDRVIVKNWTALETSIVSVPADASVGIGRGYAGPAAGILPRNHLAGRRFPVEIINPKRKDEPKMAEEAKPNVAERATEAVPAAPKSEAAPPIDYKELVRQERERIAEIGKYGRHFQVADKADEAIAAGTPLAEFRTNILGTLMDKSRDVAFPKPDSHLDLTPKEARQYSFLRLLQSELTNEPDLAGFERECGAEVAKRLDKKPKGLFVPTDALMTPMRASPALYDRLRRDGVLSAVMREISLRQLDTTTAGAAAELVGTDHLGASFIDLLRARMMVRRLGAQVLSGLQGNVDIPKQTASGAAGFVAEGAATPENKMATGKVTLTPKSLGNRQDYTRRLLLQSDPSVEMLVRDDLVVAMALAADAAAINGAGGVAPRGILNTVGIGDVSHGVDGGAPTWPTTVALETALTTANADVGNMAYLTTPQARGKYKTTEKAATTGQFIWPDVPLDADGMSQMNGYAAGSSTQVPANLTKGTGTNLSANIFANWADCLFGEWGVLDLLMDPYSGSKNAVIAVQAWLEMDFVVRRPASFAAAKDIVTV